MKITITPAPVISCPSGLATALIIATVIVASGFVRGKPPAPGEGTGDRTEEAVPEDEPAPIDIYPGESGIHQLTPTIKLVIKRESDQVNRPRDSVALQWRDDEDGVETKVILEPPGRLAPIRVVGSILWMEIPPAFGQGILGLRRIDFSDPRNLKEQRWNAGELGFQVGFPILLNPREARGIDRSILLWLSRARPCHGPTVLITAAPKDGAEKQVVLVLNPTHIESVSRLIKGQAIPSGKTTYDIRLALNDEGAQSLAAFGEKHPGRRLRLDINGETLSNKIEIHRDDVVLVKGPFDEESGRAVASYIERILRGDEAPDPEGNLINPMTEIITAGTYPIDEKTTATVTSVLEEGGIVRNELHVTHGGEDEVQNTNSAALPCGEGTWAILVAKPGKSDHGNLPLAIASAEGVAIHRSLTASELKRPHLQLGGYTRSGFFPAARIAAGDPIVHAPEWSAWMHRVQPGLKRETRAPKTPGFELRLMAEKDEPAEMIRRTPAGLAGQGVRQFHRLGRRLLTARDFTRNEVGMVMAGIVFTDFVVRKESSAEFEELCRKFNGRTAALVQEGEVWAYAELKPGLKKVSSPNMAFPKPKKEPNQ